MANFTNTASVSYNDVITNSNTVHGRILESATVTKTLLSSSYTSDGTLIYAVSITNPTDGVLSDVTVSDNMGAYVFEGTTLYPLEYSTGSAKLFVNGALVPVTDVTAGPPTVFGGIDIPAGGGALLIYEANITSCAPLARGSQIINTATVTGANCAFPVSASASANVSYGARLTVSKFISPETICGGGEITYTVVIRNSGNRDTVASDNVVVNDVFDPALSDLCVSVDGNVLPLSCYHYDSTTGDFETLPGAITVPAATFVRDGDGALNVTPGTTVLKITGNI
ncbi:MAG: hypothetical protein IKV97_07375 [Clostridia bacterium]|nr:hypothetical protein [Clostridia bacterium]